MTISVGVSNGSAAASVPSDSRIDFCLAQIPTGETSPLARDHVPAKWKRTGCWPATLHPNCFGVAEVPTGRNGPRCLPRNLIELI
jgi:hypothetical protein